MSNLTFLEKLKRKNLHLGGKYNKLNSYAVKYKGEVVEYFRTKSAAMFFVDKHNKEFFRMLEIVMLEDNL